METLLLKRRPGHEKATKNPLYSGQIDGIMLLPL